MQYVVVSGTPVMGYEVTGPFGDEEKAAAWAEEEFEGEPFWWVLPMGSPLSEPCESCGADAACDCTVALTDLPMMGKERERVIPMPPPKKLKVIDLKVLQA